MSNQQTSRKQPELYVVESIGGKVVQFSRVPKDNFPLAVWADIEQEWRVGFMPVLKIAERYGLSRSTIRDTAKRKRWGKFAADLASTINATVKASVIESAIKEARATAATGHTTPEAIARAEQDAVEQGIDQVVADYRAIVSEIISKHRSVASEARGILVTAIKEVRECQALLKNKYSGSTIARFKLVRAVTETMRVALQAIAKAIELERQAYGLDDRDDSDGMEGYESYLAKAQADSEA